MNTVIPKGQSLRNAVKWISAALKNGDKVNINKLVDEAIFTYNLSPKEAEYLQEFYNKTDC